MSGVARTVLSPSSRTIIEHAPAKRAKAGIAYAEGERVIAEALQGSWRCDVLFIDPDFADTAGGAALLKLAKGRAVSIQYASPKAFEKLSELPAPPPAGLIVRPPEGGAFSGATRRSGHRRSQWLVLDRVNDPGNAGAMIRTAAAFGFSVVLTAGSVRMTNEKMIRASAGICFHEGVLHAAGDPADVAQYFRSQSIRTLVLAPRAEAVIGAVGDAAEAIALVLGNEAAGVDESIWGWAEAVRIPMQAGVESLNVSISAAIAMYELSRGRA
ncbi:RNA methyltransferase [soil metagenome]